MISVYLHSYLVYKTNALITTLLIVMKRKCTTVDPLGLNYCLPYNLKCENSRKYCTIASAQNLWHTLHKYHLQNFKKVKNTHGGVLLLVKETLTNECFSHLLNSTNGTKSHMQNLLALPRNAEIFWINQRLNNYMAVSITDYLLTTL